MTTLYRLDAYDMSGVKQAVLIDYTFLAYTKSVNTPGFLQFGLRGDHPLLSSLTDKFQIEVYRKPEGAPWGRDFAAIYRQPEWTFTDRKNVALLCPGLMSMLAWRIVNWPANTANRTKFSAVKGETIMKTLVEYNAAASATTGNGRKRAGAITGLTVATDTAAGNTTDWYCAQENLLATLQKLAHIAGGDFDLVKTSATAWQFRWYTGQLGTDRTASVIFAIERGNMADVHYREKRIDEKTVACVWGKGEEAARDYVTRTGANYAAGNDIEVYVDAKDIAFGDTAGLNGRGDHKAKEYQMQVEFEFTALQAPATLYGVHYFLGDKITAVNPINGASLTQKVRSVSVSLDDSGQETIEPKFVAV